ncbi:MAG: DNA repair protein RecO [Patescibacteria group bacterium]|nr:DNA repair protein RecO [Patescibacteria group bacterium]
MYQTYQIEGIILKSANFGESNKYLFVITEEFGLIKITAQGLRNLRSKLRYGLQEFSVVQLSIVRGRGAWRLINAIYDKNLYFSLAKNRGKLIIANSVLNLLTQLLPGEERNEDLYKVIREALSFLEENDFSSEDIKSFENIIVVRILYCLGYFDKKKAVNKDIEYSSFLNLTEWNQDLLEKMRKGEVNRQVIFDINNSLQSSQLC